jgi:3-oxoacyl-[acyl-carrier-protein] synthase-3
MSGAVYLHGVGHFHPENVISNAFLESLDIGTSEAWIVERVGIRNRRTVLSLDYIRQTRNRDPRGAVEAAAYTNAQTGARAAALALERAGITAEQIGLVIAGGCCSDYAIPAEACRVAAELGIGAPAIDVNSACSSFGVHMHFLAMMRPEALPDFVLVVQPENTTRVVDYSDRNNAVLWGDGSSAAVVSARVPSRLRVDLTSLASNPTGWAKVVIPRLGHFAQEGRAVQTFAIKTTRELVTQLRDQMGEVPFHFIGHQANLLALQSVCRYCEIPPERHHFNVDELGNTGAAGAPSILSQRWAEWRDGDQIALAVVGSGLSWAAMRITVGAPS